MIIPNCIENSFFRKEFSNHVFVQITFEISFKSLFQKTVQVAICKSSFSQLRAQTSMCNQVHSRTPKFTSQSSSIPPHMFNMFKQVQSIHACSTCSIRFNQVQTTHLLKNYSTCPFISKSKSFHVSKVPIILFEQGNISFEQEILKPLFS